MTALGPRTAGRLSIVLGELAMLCGRSGAPRQSLPIPERGASVVVADWNVSTLAALVEWRMGQKYSTLLLEDLRGARAPDEAPP
jgi:hypothetical protein